MTAPAFTLADLAQLEPVVEFHARRLGKALQVDADDLRQHAWELLLKEWRRGKYDPKRASRNTWASRILGRMLLREARRMALPVKLRVGHEGEADPKRMRSRVDVHQQGMVGNGGGRALGNRVPEPLRDHLDEMAILGEEDG